MYDFSEPVVCRCMTQCIVKILSDQWFLNYSDPQWKELAHQAIAQMNIYPDSAKPWFNTVIDWLREWACARTTGFGTPLPWGKGWIIETLSDSTVYMAFYTINKHIKQNNIKPESLNTRSFRLHLLRQRQRRRTLKSSRNRRRACWIRCVANSSTGTHLTSATAPKNSYPTTSASAFSTMPPSFHPSTGQKPSASTAC